MGFVADLLKEKRESKGLTKRYLAKRLAMAEELYRAIENSNREVQTVKGAYKISHFLDVSPEFVMWLGRLDRMIKLSEQVFPDDPGFVRNLQAIGERAVYLVLKKPFLEEEE